MIWIKSELWPWLKKNWKWVIFPVGLIGLFISAVAGSRVVKTVDMPDDEMDENDARRREEIEEARRQRDEKLQELAEKHKARLEHLSNEQEEELQNLAEQPIDEIVAWFDRL